MLVIRGTPITSIQAKQKVTYTDATWEFTIWSINEGVSYPTIIKNSYSVILNTSFVNGTPITSIQAKQSQTYIDEGWSFANSLDNIGIWNIQEDVSYPYHRNCGSMALPLGTPLTTVKKIVIVTEDIYGSMQLNGEVLMYVKNVSITAPLSGTIEESTLYNYDGEIIEHEGKIYRYVGSGERVLNSCGGYGYYTTATSRVIPFIADYQNVANFYYTEIYSKIQTRISTSSGITILPIYERSVDIDPRLNISIPSGIGTFHLVDISSQEASPLRLRVQEGIMAVQKVDVI